MQIEWDGSDDDVIRRMQNYGNAVKLAVAQVAEYFVPVLESYAKAQAPWTDRTSNARQGLHAYVEKLAGDLVALYLSHTMEYGIMLETRNPTQPINLVGIELEFAGKYAIILPTLQVHYERIMQMLREVLA